MRCKSRRQASQAGRPPDTRERVVSVLRRHVVSGKFGPGTRLPTHEVLERRFRAASTSIRAAMRVLRDEGFVETRHREGTFVSAAPPHLRNIVVAVPHRQVPGRYWSNYYTAMIRVAGAVAEASGRPIRTVAGYESPHEAGYVELERIVRTHQAAGILFVTHPFMLKCTPILDEPGIPRLAVTATQSAYRGIDTKVHLGGEFMEKALAYLLGRGRRRIAVMFADSFWPGEYQAGIRFALAASGAICPPHWQIPIRIGSRDTACAVARLLVHSGSGAERPDALIVTDDNLVESAVSGLVAEGVRLPDDVEVVGHCNFPWPAFTLAPIRRLGPDLGQLLNESIRIIDACRAGQPAPPVVDLPMVWEEERQGGPFPGV